MLALRGEEQLTHRCFQSVLTFLATYSLMLSQLLKLNGASKVVVAANKGIKMDIAKDLEAADVYIELDR